MIFKVTKVTSDGMEVDYGLVSEEALYRILDTREHDEEVEFEEVL